MSKICIKCGGKTGNRKKALTLCSKCYKQPSGENHPRWTGNSVCPKCNGKKLYSAKHCRKCCEHKGENHWNYGNHWSDEVKMKISLGNTGKRMGVENHLFKKHKEIRRTYRFPYRKWRKEVLLLDNNTCRICGVETDIVHHIDPYKDTPDNLDVNNGVALCLKHHRETFGKEYKFITIFKEAIKKRMNSGELQNGQS